jgi:hypothetical protein
MDDYKQFRDSNSAYHRCGCIAESRIKEKRMKTKAEEVTGAQGEATASLAFRVKPMGDGLYGAEVLLMRGDVVVEKRNSPGTTLGHAIAAADDLLDGWAFNEIEQKAEDFFRNVFL